MRAWGGENQLFELDVQGFEVAVLDVLNQKKYKKNYDRHTLLMTSSQVSLKTNTGPVTSEATSARTARLKVLGWPAGRDALPVSTASEDEGLTRMGVLRLPGSLQ